MKNLKIIQLDSVLGVKELVEEMVVENVEKPVLNKLMNERPMNALDLMQSSVLQSSAGNLYSEESLERTSDQIIDDTANGLAVTANSLAQSGDNPPSLSRGEQLKEPLLTRREALGGNSSRLKEKMTYTYRNVSDSSRVVRKDSKSAVFKAEKKASSILLGKGEANLKPSADTNRLADANMLADTNRPLAKTMSSMTTADVTSKSNENNGNDGSHMKTRQTRLVDRNVRKLLASKVRFRPTVAVCDEKEAALVRELDALQYLTKKWRTEISLASQIATNEFNSTNEISSSNSPGNLPDSPGNLAGSFEKGSFEKNSFQRSEPLFRSMTSPAAISSPQASLMPSASADAVAYQACVQHNSDGRHNSGDTRSSSVESANTAIYCGSGCEKMIFSKTFQDNIMERVRKMELKIQSLRRIQTIGSTHVEMK